MKATDDGIRARVCPECGFVEIAPVEMIEFLGPFICDNCDYDEVPDTPTGVDPDDTP